MKKILIICALVAFSIKSLSQNAPSYFSRGNFKIDVGKNERGRIEKEFNGRWTAVYDWFFCQAGHSQVFKTKPNPYQRTTLFTVGVGMKRNVYDRYNRPSVFAGGVGFTGVLTPSFDTASKNNLFLGGTLFGVFQKEDNFELEGNLSYSFLPHVKQWKRSKLMVDLKMTKFFGPVFGLGLGCSFDMNQAQSPSNYDRSFSDMKTTLNPFIVLKSSRNLMFVLGVDYKLQTSTDDDPNLYPVHVSETRDLPLGYMAGIVVTFVN